MSAVILAFPRPSPIQALCRVSTGAAPFTPAWCAQHLPLIDAAMDLLEPDDVEFARRCQAMRDEDGRAILNELAGQLQRLGTHIADVADALGLTAARIRDQMTAHPRPGDRLSHSDVFAASNGELEDEQRRLEVELGNMLRQRNGLAQSLPVEGDNVKRLKHETAQHVSRAHGYRARSPCDID